MAPKPFTYEHFILAVQSLKDDMLMYYIDEAVAIYCRIKGKSVGPRPASSKDYSQEYSDAFEAANYAIYIVANKIGAYNPDKGAFRPYLRKALESALRDIFRADGYETLSGSSEIENEPDTSASDAEERVRQHKDDALETMIRFIDALPEIKRAAIYASAFGQILRPDLEGYGRNYADILAGIYHTTALYIRQLATEGKKAALAEARRQGFSESSMNEVYMGFLQAEAPAKDVNDEVIQATEQLGPYQQFMLLRHLAGKIDENEVINSNNVKAMSAWGEMRKRSSGELTRKESQIVSKEALAGLLEDMVKDKDVQRLYLPAILDDIPDPQRLIRDMIPIEDPRHLLTERQTLLLQSATLLPFSFGGFVSLEDMLTKLGVRIIIEPGIRYHTAPLELVEAADYWKKEAARLKPGGGPQYADALRMMEYYLEQVRLWGKMPIRGEYIPHASPSDTPVIRLYPEEMQAETDNAGRMKELLVSTFVHEAMHAYFDRPPHDAFPYVCSIEEPMAEFGMLLFLYEMKLHGFFIWARHDVAGKVTCYRYGVGLLYQCLAEGAGSKTRKDLEAYKVPLF